MTELPLPRRRIIIPVAVCRPWLQRAASQYATLDEFVAAEREAARLIARVRERSARTSA